jgi:hypothetical protein
MAPPFRIDNPPTQLDMNKFWATMDGNDGIVSAARFIVRLTPVNGIGTNNWLLQNGFSAIMNDLTYLCDSAELPGRAFDTFSYRYYGPTHQVPFVTHYEDIDLTFICRQNMRERAFFDDWMELINPTNSYDFNYKDDYSCNITIFQLGEGNSSDENATYPEANYAYTVKKAYPIIVNSAPMTWADQNILRVAVKFTHMGVYRPYRDMKPQGFDLEASTSPTQLRERDAESGV